MPFMDDVEASVRKDNPLTLIAPLTATLGQFFAGQVWWTPLTDFLISVLHN
jgi:hypothetical protein